MIKYVINVVAGGFLLISTGQVLAQQVNRTDHSEPSPGEIAMAAECRDTYERMRALEKELDAHRDEVSAMDIDIKKSGQKLDELENLFKQKSAKSQESDEAYKAALEAKLEYETAASAHNLLIDKQDEMAKTRVGMTDEFFVVNPSYVTKCSGTIFKYKSIILTCKDEESEWCELLK